MGISRVVVFRRVAIACFVASVFGVGAVGATQSEAHAVTPKTALVYGDSIAFESRFAIADRMALKPGWTLWTHTLGGSAACDWLSWLAYDLATYQPSIVAIETVGNNNRPCMMVDGTVLPRGSAGLHAKFEADLDAMVATITATGAKVLIVRGPPMLDAAWNADVTALGPIATNVARRYPGVSVTATARNSVSASGKYVAFKACLTAETAAMGCDTITRKIAVRTVVGSQTGIHLCPTGLVPLSPCSVYSSGEYRFGRAMANAIASPPAPLYGT